MSEITRTGFIRHATLAAVLVSISCTNSVAAELSNFQAVPHLDGAGRQGYRDFLAANKHRAFAIAPGGAWSWKGGEATAESASRDTLQACQDDSGVACILYAVDDWVVFDAKSWARLWGPYLNRAEASKAHVGLNRGERFYNLTFKNTDGKSVSLSDLQGKVVLLHFWGSWCPPCRNEMPDLQKLYKTLGDTSDIRVVLLQVQEDFDASRKWAKQQHLRLPLYDSGVKGKAMSSLTLADGRKIPDRDIAPAFPTTYILDKHGIVIFSNIGPLSHWPQYLPLLNDAAERSGR